MPVSGEAGWGHNFQISPGGDFVFGLGAVAAGEVLEPAVQAGAVQGLAEFGQGEQEMAGAGGTEVRRYCHIANIIVIGNDGRGRRNRGAAGGDATAVVVIVGSFRRRWAG